MTEQRNLSFQDYEALVTRLTGAGMLAASGYLRTNKPEWAKSFVALYESMGRDRTAALKAIEVSLRYEIHRRVLELLKSDPPKHLDEIVAALGVDAARELLVEHCKN